MAFSWILFFTGCLRIYVPDRPYDPALIPLVQRGRQKKRRDELKFKLKALQIFEAAFSGQEANTRCQVVMNELQALGGQPDAPPVLRPQASELVQLQQEFNNILQSIVSHASDLSRAIVGNRDVKSRLQYTQSLRSNIEQAISRLSEGFHVYEDLKIPALAMLKGLDAGLAMAQLAHAPIQKASRTLHYICISTPFMGMEGIQHAEEAIPSFQENGVRLYEPRFRYLKVAVLAQRIIRNPNRYRSRTLFETIHTIYRDWKEQLEEDQRGDFTKRSIYRFRGGEAEEEVTAEKDFQQIFPSYDAQGPQDEQNVRSLDQRQLSQTLARLQRSLFNDDMPIIDRILDVLLNSCSDIARSWHCTSFTSINPIPIENLLSGIILSLAISLDHIDGSFESTQYSNFYTDSNLAEARKVVSLVRRIQLRFMDLKKVWPEHAILDHVLRISEELLLLGHSDPIAKILTKVEQLHSFAHEWQLVASKEYSAAELYDELTALIISWRRLELSTWARLLDAEDRKCQDEVDSWWCVVYEAAVAAPLSFIELGEKLQPHAEKLFETLQEFIISSSLGHFSHRLRLLIDFRKYLDMLEHTIPGLSIICLTVSNFLGYYTHFEEPVQQWRRKDRLTTEKEMKDVLLLASWKDTNVDALRESARRSHHRLFKVVRKYRSILQQPVQNVINQGFPEVIGQPEIAPLIRTQTPYAVDGLALRLCKNHSVLWSDRPARFIKISSTISNMIQISQMPPTMLQMPLSVDSFANDLVEAMTMLRKETPSTADNKNEELLKHLVSRKRKLYTDTLKSLRQMGFRPNPSGNILARQKSHATICAHLPALSALARTSDLQNAQDHLLKALYFMPQARESIRNHSNDLSPSEISRSIGFLESCLSTTLLQWRSFGQFGASVRLFDKAFTEMENLWSPGIYDVEKESSSSSAVPELEEVLSWLPHILDAGCIIIEKHGKLGSMDHSAVLESLKRWSSRLKVVVAAFTGGPDLPTGLTSSLHDQIQQQAKAELDQLRAELNQWIEQYPQVAFVLKQIQLWTKSSPITNGTYHEPSSINVVQWNKELLNICDAILVAFQQFEKSTSNAPTQEDEKWLVNSERNLTRSIEALHIDDIIKMMRKLLSQINQIHGNELHLANAAVAIVLPIFKQFRSTLEYIYAHIAQSARALSRLTSTLAQSFVQVASQGFCVPSATSDQLASKSEKIEEGTGLGEGDGADDISKDVQDDEDLSELAQQGQKSTDGEELLDQQDAVDMDHDDLEGETGDAPEANEDNASEEGSGSDFEDEVGDVDDLNPAAVDERLWDEAGQEAQKEKKGKKSSEESEREKQLDEIEQGDQNDGRKLNEEDDLDSDGVEENEEVSHQQGETMDPRLQQEENLDLPDEMKLDGDNKSQIESELDDSDLEAMSDVQQETTQTDESNESDEAIGDDGAIQERFETGTDTGNEEEEKSKNAGSPKKAEADEKHDEDELLQNPAGDASIDENNMVPSDMQGLQGDKEDDTTEGQSPEDRIARSAGGKGDESDGAEQRATGHNGQLGERQDDSLNTPYKEDAPSTDNTFKKLGDALEKWHRQQRQIRRAQEKPSTEHRSQKDVETADQVFEHLEDDSAEADTQALGGATEEQAQTLDQRALDSEVKDQPREFPVDENESSTDDQDEVMENVESRALDGREIQEPSGSRAFINSSNLRQLPAAQSPDTTHLPNDDLQDLDTNLSITHLEATTPSHPRSPSSSYALWSHHSSRTRPLSLTLTEQLRLILAPTLATKMRGDFRTGKRLNIKRIIPYIASGYKRDKIWMRRSVPSKRSYQIMLAVDDSKSMGESGSGDLAFETLALVARSLSMLEVGEICIVGFGEDVTVAHPFGETFTDERGAEVFSRFGFAQRKTDVRKLVARSLSLFRDARARNLSRGAEELWQLQLIISDGVCEDHEGIRRLVRQALEERVMIVFVIVDSVQKGRGESILDMSEAVFESVGGDGEGEQRLRVRRYLDGFPFGYYVVVGEVRELPEVLCQALRGWFSEVVEQG